MVSALLRRNVARVEPRIIANQLRRWDACGQNIPVLIRWRSVSCPILSFPVRLHRTDSAFNAAAELRNTVDLLQELQQVDAVARADHALRALNDGSVNSQDCQKLCNFVIESVTSEDFSWSALKSVINCVPVLDGASEAAVMRLAERACRVLAPGNDVPDRVDCAKMIIRVLIREASLPKSVVQRLNEVEKDMLLGVKELLPMEALRFLAVLGKWHEGSRDVLIHKSLLGGLFDHLAIVLPEHKLPIGRNRMINCCCLLHFACQLWRSSPGILSSLGKVLGVSAICIQFPKSNERCWGYFVFHPPSILCFNIPDCCRDSSL